MRMPRRFVSSRPDQGSLFTSGDGFSYVHERTLMNVTYFRCRRYPNCPGIYKKSLKTFFLHIIHRDVYLYFLILFKLSFENLILFLLH